MQLSEQSRPRLGANDAIDVLAGVLLELAYSCVGHASEVAVDWANVVSLIGERLLDQSHARFRGAAALRACTRVRRLVGDGFQFRWAVGEPAVNVGCPMPAGFVDLEWMWSLRPPGGRLIQPRPACQ